MLPHHKASVPVDAEMLESITRYGNSAQQELDTSIVHMDLGTIKFFQTLRRNYVLDRLQLQLKSQRPEDVTEYYVERQILDGQVALLTYLLEVNDFKTTTEE